MKLGDGYDLDRQIVTSALSDVRIEPSHTSDVDNKEKGGDFEYQFHAVSDEREFKKAIDASLDGGGSMPFVFSADTSTRLSRDIQFSDTTMTTIIRCTITLHDTKVVSSASLTASATRLLRRRFSRSLSKPFGSRPQKVLDQFGQYYIYSYTSKSSIEIVSTHTASTKEELNEFRTRTESSWTGVSMEQWSEKLVFNRLKNNKNLSVRTTTKVDCKGYNLTGIADGLASNDAANIFQNFLKNNRPERCLAILRPLSSLHPKIPRPMLVLSPPMKEEWMQSLYLTNRAQSSEMVGAQQLSSRLSSLAEDIKGLILAKAPDEVVFKSLIEKRKGYEAEITKFEHRMRLLNESRAGDQLSQAK